MTRAKAYCRDRAQDYYDLTTDLCFRPHDTYVLHSWLIQNSSTRAGIELHVAGDKAGTGTLYVRDLVRGGLEIQPFEHIDQALAYWLATRW